MVHKALPTSIKHYATYRLLSYDCKLECLASGFHLWLVTQCSAIMWPPYAIFSTGFLRKWRSQQGALQAVAACPEDFLLSPGGGGGWKSSNSSVWMQKQNLDPEDSSSVPTTPPLTFLFCVWRGAKLLQWGVEMEFRSQRPELHPWSPLEQFLSGQRRELNSGASSFTPST